MEDSSTYKQIFTALITSFYLACVCSLLLMFSLKFETGFWGNSRYTIKVKFVWCSFYVFSFMFISNSRIEYFWRSPITKWLSKYDNSKLEIQYCYLLGNSFKTRKINILGAEKEIYINIYNKRKKIMAKLSV